ncbi:MAG TPA: ORF6N domain-containing protein [Pirellulaceae bacterium]|nr:ORF6N domain-containing protein [Pirellulaceae bacterium]
MAKSSAIVVDQRELERKIFIVRGQRVMLDSDLAKLYAVPTKRLNEQVQRNADRFPEDFAYQLTAQEFTDLKSQIATSSVGHGGKRKLPWVFTEHGVAMLSSVLRSPRAVQVNIAIMRAFVRMRRLIGTPGELVTQLNELAKTVQLHDDQIAAIADVLRKLMEPPSTPPKRKIGFLPPESRLSQNSPTAHSQNGARK